LSQKIASHYFATQSAVRGQTESVLSSLLEVDRDISDRLIGMTQQELEIIRTAIESVSSLLIEQFYEEEAAGTKIQKNLYKS
jgi:hypothetical protein